MTLWALVLVRSELMLSVMTNGIDLDWPASVAQLDTPSD